MRGAVTLVALATALILAPAGVAADGRAPGGPGARTAWAPADKAGFGTAHSQASRPAFTLQDGTLSEVYYPTLGTPSVRRLELVVARGGKAERESSATRHEVSLADPKSLTYRQVNTDRQGQYRIEKTWITDPARDTVLLARALPHPARQAAPGVRPLRPGAGQHRRGRPRRQLRRCADRARPQGRQRRAGPAGLQAQQNGFLGRRSDGWRDLRRDGRLSRNYRLAGKGNVVQTAQTALTGRGRSQSLTLAIGLGASKRRALNAARGSLREGFTRVAGRYAAGWHGYLASLPAPPASAAPYRGLYDASVMVMAALEDKTHRGASVASPSMPWAWGDGTVEKPSGPVPPGLVA